MAIIPKIMNLVLLQKTKKQKFEIYDFFYHLISNQPYLFGNGESDYKSNNISKFK